MPNRQPRGGGKLGLVSNLNLKWQHDSPTHANNGNWLQRRIFRIMSIIIDERHVNVSQ